MVIATSFVGVDHFLSVVIQVGRVSPARGVVPLDSGSCWCQFGLTLHKALLSFLRRKKNITKAPPGQKGEKAMLNIMKKNDISRDSGLNPTGNHGCFPFRLSPLGERKKRHRTPLNPTEENKQTNKQTTILRQMEVLFYFPLARSSSTEVRIMVPTFFCSLF